MKYSTEQRMRDMYALFREFCPHRTAYEHARRVARFDISKQLAARFARITEAI